MTRLSDIVRDQHSMLPSAGMRPVSTVASFQSRIDHQHPPETAGQAKLPDWYRLADEELSRLAVRIRQQASVPADDLVQVAAGMVKSLRQDDTLLIRALSHRKGPSVITNAVNVSIIATKMGLGLGYQAMDLERLALAGLLHDVGMFLLSESVVGKSEPLTTAERAAVEQHPQQGRHILMSLGKEYDWLAEVAFQEHERWSGQGYPRKLKGTEIQEYAQIIGLADVFDALISPRPYHAARLPHHALRELLTSQKDAFAQVLLKALVEQLSMYPLGTRVRLNTGEVGIVTQLNRQNPFKPILSMDQPVDVERRASPDSVDLSRSTQVHIVEVLQLEEFTVVTR
ncbi:MAG: HD-GYP domain-containing protein [Nitrospiraceae bacterium]